MNAASSLCGTGRVMRQVTLGVCVCLVGLAGCAQRAARPIPTKAIWVTRFDYKSPQDVTQIMQNCAEAGFDAVVFQVRGHGTAHYRSKYEPWDDSLGGKDPGWDPLELAIREARARKLQLHAWVNVMPAWRGTTPPDNPEQLYNKHPDWFWYDQNGKRQELSSFYVSLNPCLPEVREYIVAVFRDIAANYDIDGLHMDYVRFPNEPPATPKGSGLDYPRDARTVALFKEATGKAPDEDPVAWKQWRTERVTELVGDIQKMLHRTRPRAALTASVGSVPANALTHFQDGLGWARTGLVDAAFLMNYTASPEEFEKRLTPWLDPPPKAAIIPGLSIGSHARKEPEAGARDALKQIEIGRTKTGRTCIFAYTYLFDSADPGELEKQSEKQRQIKSVRREIILPALRAAPMQ